MHIITSYYNVNILCLRLAWGALYMCTVVILQASVKVVSGDFSCRENKQALGSPSEISSNSEIWVNFSVPQDQTMRKDSFPTRINTEKSVSLFFVRSVLYFLYFLHVHNMCSYPSTHGFEHHHWLWKCMKFVFAVITRDLVIARPKREEQLSHQVTNITFGNYNSVISKRPLVCAFISAPIQCFCRCRWNFRFTHNRQRLQQITCSWQIRHTKHERVHLLNVLNTSERSCSKEVLLFC